MKTMYLHQYNYRESQQRYYDAEPEYSYDEADDWGREFRYEDHTPSEIGDWEAEQAHGLAEFDTTEAKWALEYADELTLDEFADIVATTSEAEARVKTTSAILEKRYEERRERERQRQRERIQAATRARQLRAMERDLQANNQEAPVIAIKRH